MDTMIQELKKGEHDWLEGMDNLVADIKAMGVAVDLPCLFIEIPEYARGVLNEAQA